ncbi:MAG: hypothetical protein FD169_2074 [Bacillota bacterium]|nr:MAG: hypothetical protein FD169_2074 [Bacillota bacterium]
MTINPKYMDSIEWEGLQDQYVIKEEVKAQLLQNTVNSRIELRRDENYLIEGNITGTIHQGEKELSIEHGQAGERIEPFIIEGSNCSQLEQFRIEQCYIGNITYTYELQNSGNYARKYDATLNTFYIKRFFQSKDNVEWLTEWYLNGPRGPFWFPRTTERKYTETFERNRADYSTQSGKFLGDTSEGFSRDYLLVQLLDYSCIIHKVPKSFGPTWSENIGIEYRVELGQIPSIETREAIAEIVSFVFGRQLFNIGHSLFDKHGNPLEQVSISPWADDAARYSKRHESSPIIAQDYTAMSLIEDCLKSLIPRYLELRDEFALNDVIQRYWLAGRLPIGTNIPMLHNGIEILANSWFRSKRTKTSGVYLPKNEFDRLLAEDFETVAKKLEALPHGARILNRMKGSFQTGANEKIELFLQELGLEIGDLERKSIRERNKMIHGSPSRTDVDIDNSILLANTYKTFFHRVILKIMSYQGLYIDYSVLGWPQKHIDEVAGTPCPL